MKPTRGATDFATDEMSGFYEGSAGGALDVSLDADGLASGPTGRDRAADVSADHKTRKE